MSLLANWIFLDISLTTSLKSAEREQHWRYTSSSSSPPPVSACLRTAGLPTRLLPISATGSITTTFGSNVHNAPLCSAWTRGEAAGLRSHPQRRCALSLTVIRCLPPAHLTSSPPRPARVDGCGCRFDGAKQALLIEGSQAASVGPLTETERKERRKGKKQSVHWRDCDCEWTALHQWFSAVTLSHLWKKMADRAEMFSLSTFHSLSPPGCR